MTAREQDQQRLRLQQLAVRADRLDTAVAGRFVAGEERAFAVHAAREMQLQASFSGGWQDAERVQVCMHPAHVPPVFSACWVEAVWHARFGSPDHRSLLGSLLALGMDRSFFGDLIVQGDRAYLYALPEAAARLPGEWTQAGRVSLTVALLDGTPQLEAPRGQALRDTVASLRLDCVVSSGMRVSRAQAAEIIREGMIQLDHNPEERPDRLLECGSLVSIRGFGRIRVTDVGERTRKDRLPVTLEIFHQA